jgi:GNAT superfamily N-acetyltransferase
MVEIRELTESDIDAVAEVHVRAWRSGYAGIVPADVLDALDPAVFAERRRSRPVPPGAQTLVAIDDATIIGFATFGPYRLEPGDRYDVSAGELYALYVDPAHQREGAGKLLLAAAKAGLARAGFPVLRLWVLTENHPARRFYEHLGLAPDGERHYYTPRGSTVQLPELRYAGRL